MKLNKDFQSTSIHVVNREFEVLGVGLGSKLTWWKEMEVSGSHGGAKQQQRVFVVVGSCRESLGAIGSR